MSGLITHEEDDASVLLRNKIVFASKESCAEVKGNCGSVQSYLVDWRKLYAKISGQKEMLISYWSKVLHEAEQNYEKTHGGFPLCKVQRLCLKLACYHPYYKGHKLAISANVAALEWSLSLSNRNARLA